MRRYVNLALELGLEPDGPEPNDEQLAKLAALNLSTPAQVETPAADILRPHTEQIRQWLNNEKLQLTRIHELLGQRGLSVSYSSLRRFFRSREAKSQTQSVHHLKNVYYSGRPRCLIKKCNRNLGPFIWPQSVRLHVRFRLCRPYRQRH